MIVFNGRIRINIMNVRKNKCKETVKIKKLSSIAVLNTLKTIKKGKVFDLGMEISEKFTKNKEGIFPFSMIFEETPEDSRKSFKEIEKTSKISFSNEVIISSTHTSTHIDALCHIHLDDKVIGKFNVNDIRTKKGWQRFGAETIPLIIGRGILLDIAKHLSKEKLGDEHIIYLNEIKDYLNYKNRSIEFGDIVCIRTGKIKDFYRSDYFIKGSGIGVEAANWLCDKRMSVLCLDNNSIDPTPIKDFNNTVHINMLYKNSIYLIENIYLEELPKEDIFDFFSFVHH